MSAPESLSPSPLTSLGDHSFNKLIDNDFSTGKVTLKAKATSATEGQANFKGWLDVARKNAPNQEIKLQFPYNKQVLSVTFVSYYVWFATRANETKIHLDFGKYHIVKDQNLFANIQLYNSSQHLTLRFGSVYKGEKCLSHARFEWKNRNDFNFLLRAQVRQKNWLYTLVEEACLNKKEFNRFDFLLGYQEKDWDIYLRHVTVLNSKYRLFSNFGLGRVIFNGIYRRNSQTYGSELEYSFANGSYKCFLAAQTRLSDVDLKGRVNVLTKTVSVSLKKKINNRFNLTVAGSIPIDGSAPQQEGIFPLPIGITLETSV